MLPLLIDLDGVLRIDGRLARGAKKLLSVIQERKIPACILSNTTRLPADAIAAFFGKENISLSGIPVHTALLATHDYVMEKYKSAAVHCAALSKKVFDDIPQNELPEAVIIGDLGRQWSYDVMNDIFRQVMRGADLIAMHMNKFQKEEGRLMLDAGPFIAAIEYATGKKATLIGKPSKIFFTTALRKLKFNENSGFVMIGDDLEADIKAAQDAGGKGILVLTGKTSRDMLLKSSVRPDKVAANLDEVIHLL